MTENVSSINLWGSMGQSDWRAPFIEHFSESDLMVFDPRNFYDGTPSHYLYEHPLLHNPDALHVFGITGETGSLMSLGEAAHLITYHGNTRPTVMYLSQEVDERIDGDTRRLSLQFRKDVAAMALQVGLSPTFRLVDSLDSALQDAIEIVDRVGVAPLR